MKLDAYVQGTFYKNITVPNTNSALILITQDIQNGLVPNFNPNKPASIRLSAPTDLPVPNPFDKWAAVAPQNPQRFDVWLAPDESEWIYDQPRDANGRYVADDPDTPEKESGLRWVLHAYVNR